MGLPGEALALSLKYVPSIALSHFHPVHSSYKEADLTASGERRKQLSLPNAKDFFSSAFTSSPAPKSLPRSDHGNKAYPGDYSRLVLDREKSKQGLRLHSAGSISCAESSRDSKLRKRKIFILGQACSGKEMPRSYLIFWFQREAIRSPTQA